VAILSLLDPRLTPFPGRDPQMSFLDPKVDPFCIEKASVNRSFRALSRPPSWRSLLDLFETPFNPPLPGGDPTQGHFDTSGKVCFHQLSTLRAGGTPLSDITFGPHFEVTLRPPFGHPFRHGKEVTSGPHFGTPFWCHFCDPLSISSRRYKSTPRK